MLFPIPVGVEDVSDASKTLSVTLVTRVLKVSRGDGVASNGDFGGQGIIPLAAGLERVLAEIARSHADARSQRMFAKTNMPSDLKKVGGRFPRIHVPERSAELGMIFVAFVDVALLKTDYLYVGPVTGYKVSADGFPHKAGKEPETGRGDNKTERKGGGPPFSRPRIEKRGPLALALGLGSNFFLAWGLLRLNDGRRLYGAALTGLGIAVMFGGLLLAWSLGIPATWRLWT